MGNAGGAHLVVGVPHGEVELLDQVVGGVAQGAVVVPGLAQAVERKSEKGNWLPSQ